MRRVAEVIDLVVVAPVPWFPFQRILNRFRPHSRPAVPPQEFQDGIIVYHPRFFCFPVFFKWTDGYFQALGSYWLMKKLRYDGFSIIDAHFIYPDGVAASLLARWLDFRYTITLRGSLIRFGSSRWHRRQIVQALTNAARVFSVADAMRQDAINWGQAPDHIEVISNGVDIERFRPENRAECRRRLGLTLDDRVLISVGGLSIGKGFHKVIEILPDLIQHYPKLNFIIAGGPSPAGDIERLLRQQISNLGLESRVHLLGPIHPDLLRFIYSAGDVFVLATRSEGWANVFLEASACGLPIVTTQVGGNAEVVSSDKIGILVPYDDREALYHALRQALEQPWDRSAILDYARANSWQTRIPILIAAFQSIHDRAYQSPKAADQ